MGHNPCTAQHGVMNGASSEHASAPLRDSPDTQAAPASSAAAAAAGVGGAAGMQHCFSEEILDSAVHFQVMDLGRQLYICVGTSAAQMGSLCFASPLGPTTGAFLSHLSLLHVLHLLSIWFRFGPQSNRQALVNTTENWSF